MSRLADVATPTGGRWFEPERVQESRSSVQASQGAPVTAFDPEDVALLRKAFEEACGTLEARGAVGSAKRREIASCIVHHAKGGMRDPSRLAMKGVVRAG